MTMRMHSIKYCLIIAFGFALGGCKKELNVYPTSSEVDGNVIVDVKSASTALNGVYYRFANAGLDNNSLPSILWVDINEAIPSQLSGLLLNPNSNDLSSHTYKPGDSEPLTLWTYGYGIVNAANGFLKNITPVSFLTNDAKQELIGEAKFLRAYANSELLLYYGQYYDTSSAYGILLRTEFVAPDNISQARIGVKESYDSIFADLDNAIASLPGTNTQIAYANSWAAKLLKARTLINRGGTGDYAQVISLTNDIITNGPFSLEPNLKDLFLTKGLTSNEVILGVQPYPVQNYKYFQLQNYAQYAPSDPMVSLFAGDPRSSWIFDSVVTRYGTVLELSKYYPGSRTSIAPAPITENSYALRLTEAYLLEAEALTLSGGSLSQAKSLLETVLSHAGITDFSGVEAETTAAGLQWQIVKEEMRNFVGEAGQDWYAVRRLPFTTLQTLIPSIGTKDQLILPISANEIVTNAKLKQNPNY